jgi:hypothetical protein
MARQGLFVGLFLFSVLNIIVKFSLYPQEHSAFYRRGVPFAGFYFIKKEH